MAATTDEQVPQSRYSFRISLLQFNLSKTKSGSFSHCYSASHATKVRINQHGHRQPLRTLLYPFSSLNIEIFTSSHNPQLSDTLSRNKSTNLGLTKLGVAVVTSFHSLLQEMRPEKRL